MRNFLPILFFLVLIFPLTVSAEDISTSVSTPAPSSQIVETQGNIFSDIIDRLQKKQIYTELKNINKGLMPASVVIEESAPAKVNKNDSEKEAIVETKDAKVNLDTIPNVAGQYAIGTGLNTPYKVSKVGSNIFDWFGELINSIAGVFGKGNEEAAKYVDLRTATKVQKEIIGHKEEEITPTPSIEINTEGGFQTNAFNGLINNSDSDSNMEKALSISRCSYLPIGVCTEGELTLEKLE